MAVSDGVCELPVTGNDAGLLVVGLFLVVAGVLMIRWIRTSNHRLSVFAVVPLALAGLVSTNTPDPDCLPPTTTIPAPESTTTTMPAPGSTPAPAPTTTIPVTPDLAQCVTAIEGWLPSMVTVFQTQSASNSPEDVVKYFESLAQSEFAVCASLDLVENGTEENPDAGEIFGVGFSYDGTSCITPPCNGGNGGALLGDGGDGGNARMIGNGGNGRVGDDGDDGAPGGDGGIANGLPSYGGSGGLGGSGGTGGGSAANGSNGTDGSRAGSAGVG